MDKKHKVNSYAPSIFKHSKFVVFTTALDKFGDEVAHGIYDTAEEAQGFTDRLNNEYKYEDFGEAYIVEIPYFQKR